MFLVQQLIIFSSTFGTRILVMGKKMFRNGATVKSDLQQQRFSSVNTLKSRKKSENESSSLFTKESLHVKETAQNIFSFRLTLIQKLFKGEI